MSAAVAAVLIVAGIIVVNIPYPAPVPLPPGATEAEVPIFGAHAGCAMLPLQASSAPIAYVYVNGIRSDENGVEGSARALRDALCAAGLLTVDDRVISFGDPTNPPIGEREVERGPLAAVESLAVQGARATPRRHDYVGNAYAFISDVTGAALEETRARVNQQHASWRGKRLAPTIGTLLQTGYRVVLVPHSRGTSIVKNALLIATTQSGGDDVVRCTAVAAAAPVSRLSWPAGILVRGVYATTRDADDVVDARARPIIEGFQRLIAGRSRRENDDSLHVAFRRVSVLNPDHQTLNEGQLHDFVQVYVGDIVVRNELLRDIDSAGQHIRRAACRTADANRRFAHLRVHRDPGEQPVAP